MKSLRAFLVPALSALAVVSAQAQQRFHNDDVTTDELVRSVGLERLPSSLPIPLDARNVTKLQQSGNLNTARIDQQSLAAASNQTYIVQAGAANVLGLTQIGSGNRLNVIQNGADNRASYTQEGRNNATTIAQDGAHNRIQGVIPNADMVLEGDNNTMKITQTGNNNTVRGEVRESNRNYEIRQYGHDNTLVQVESTLQTPKGYTVEMRGQGINLTIEQSKVR